MTQRRMAEYKPLPLHDGEQLPIRVFSQAGIDPLFLIEFQELPDTNGSSAVYARAALRKAGVHPKREFRVAEGRRFLCENPGIEALTTIARTYASNT